LDATFSDAHARKHLSALEQALASTCDPLPVELERTAQLTLDALTVHCTVLLEHLLL
jgi:hypothetical protein